MQNALSASFSFTRRLLLLLTAVSSIALSANGAYASGPFSADGRYFVFDTPQALLASDTNGFWDVYRLDRQTDGLTLVSVNQNNTGSGDGDSSAPVISAPVISADGNVVAFVSFARNLASPDTSGNLDVFVRDLTAGVTTLISVNQAGTGSGNGASDDPGLSADGRFVYFESTATNLVAIADHNGEDEEFTGVDVFVRDRVTGVTTLVSVTQDGSATLNDGSADGAISADGRVVVFTSFRGEEGRDVFARDLAAGVTSLVSVSMAGTGSGNAESFGPQVNADGTRVTFTSGASDLTANDTNGRRDVFVRNLATGVTTLVSVNQTGTGSGNAESADSFSSAVNADGTIVAFGSLASDLVPGDNNSAEDVFARDLTTGVTTLATINRDGTGSANGESRFHALSANGEVLAFESRASDLTANSVDGMANVFVRNLKTGVTQLVSANSSGSGSGSTTWSGYIPGGLFPRPTFERRWQRAGVSERGRPDRR